MSDDLEDLDLEADWRLLRPKRGRALVLDEKRFGRLVVIKREGSDKHGATLWRCVCDCGKEKVVARPNLVGGRVKSCGCLQAEYLKKPNKTGLRRGRGTGITIAARSDHQHLDLRFIAWTPDNFD